jgi:hypothetical protein
MSNPSTLPRVQGPTFETCIFGPKGIPVAIEPLTNSEKDLDNTVKDLSDSLQKVELEMEENRNYNRDKQTLEKDVGLEPQEKDEKDGPKEVVNSKSIPLSTPPQSPLKVSRPLRPSKLLSGGKVKQESPTVSNQKMQSSDIQSNKAHIINLQELRRLSSLGVPTDCSLRPLAWRILLGYLPLDTSKWQNVLDRDRSLYRTLVKELFVQSDDYPFEEEGKKLIGKGLEHDGKRVVSSSTNKHLQSAERVEEAMNELKSKTADGSNSHNEVLGQSGDDSFGDDELQLVDIPISVREQWRKSGRTPESLWAGAGKGKLPRLSSEKQHGRSVSVSICNFNALSVNAIDTNESTSNDEIDDILKIVTSGEGEFDPKWKNFLENASLLDEIRKDVVRTHHDLQFFLDQEDFKGTRRHAAIERILFVWAKLNKGVRYVQGMNEIVGTLYFVLANDRNEEWASEAEADVYFLFNTLMVEMRDIFVPDLDDADTGIQGRMANMIALLSLHDPEVRCHLDDCGIDPGFYSIRWLTTLLSREFSPSDTIRLWDSMFASTHKDNFMRYVCVCMVMIIRDELLQGDFGTCLRLLQAYPSTDVDKLLESSRALWIYESQVTLACHKGGISLSQALTTIAPPPAVIMAYGLSGGLALDQIEVMRQTAMQNINKQKGRFKNGGRYINQTTATAGKSFFGLFGNKK